MEAINSIEIVPQTKQKQFKFLLCPYCWKRIPLITLVKQEHIFILYLDCFCLREVKQIKLSDYLNQIKSKSKSLLTNNCSYSNAHQDQSANQYCINCQKWLCNDCFCIHQHNNPDHLITPKELTLSIDCNTHETNPNNIVNKQNNQTICVKCNDLLLIKEMPIKAIDDFSLVKVALESTNILQQDLFVKIDKSIKKNKELKDTIITLIQEKIIFFENIKEEIVKHYEINNAFNQQIKRLLAFVCGTYNTIRHNPLSDKFVLLKKNLAHFKYNDNTLEINASNVELSSKMILKHFQESYILKINLIDEVLTSHTDKVLSLIQLSNYQLASGSLDSTIKLWDLSTLKCINTLQGHKEGVVKLLQLNPTYFASGAKDGEIRLWNLTNFTLALTLKEHGESITGLVRINDTKFASSSSDCCIKLWISTQSHSVLSFKAHKDEISSIIISNDLRLISSSFDSTIKFWNISEMKLEYLLNAHRFPIFSLSSLKSEVIASGSFREIKVWNINTMICLSVIEGLSGNTGVLSRINDTLFASVSKDQLIKIWDSTKMKCVNTIESHCGMIFDLILLKGDFYFASGTENNSIELFRKKKDNQSQFNSISISNISKSKDSNCFIV